MFRFLIIIFFFSDCCLAQNLVPNPSFEDSWTCPESFTKERIKKILPEWFVPNLSTPDYFNKCNTTDVSVPHNFTGSMAARDGNAYIGIILKESFNPGNEKYDPGKDEYSREYVSAKLLTPLKHLKLYCVTFNYCLAKYSDYVVDALGVYFSKDKLKVRNDGMISAKQQIFKKGKLLKSKNNWEEFCGVIAPRGGEKYINIGNFTSTKDVQYVKIDSGENNFMSKYAYYLIDNVKVFSIENDFECGCKSGETEIVKEYIALNNNLKNNKAKDTKGNQNKEKQPESNNIRDKKNSSKENNNRDIENINGMDNINGIEIGTSVTLNNIFFDHEQAILTTESSEELNKLVNLLNENPDMQIEISGYSDNTGSDEFNNKLSFERAKAVADYLREKKIKKKRLSWKGFGNTMPVADNNSEEGRAKNRRVEFKIVKK